ncbi:MAG: hypothetical protein VB140_05790 [Burkholderia sp.]
MLHKSSVRTQWHRLKLCPSMLLCPHARFMQQRHFIHETNSLFSLSKVLVFLINIDR